MGIDGVLTPAEDVVVVEGGGVGGGREGEEGGLWLFVLLARVGDGRWERPPRYGMWNVGSVNSVAGRVRVARGWCVGRGCVLPPWKEAGGIGGL